MNESRTYSSVTRIAHLALLGAVVLCGCGEGRPERVAVSGRVLIDGRPVEHGFIRLIAPSDRPSVAELGPDGRFELTCFADKDGAVLGTHQVTVTAVEVLGPRSQKWHAPKKYANPSTSELTATIDGPTDSLTIELSWDGGEPFVEELQDE